MEHLWAVPWKKPTQHFAKRKMHLPLLSFGSVPWLAVTWLVYYITNKQARRKVMIAAEFWRMTREEWEPPVCGTSRGDSCTLSNNTLTGPSEVTSFLKNSFVSSLFRLVLPPGFCTHPCAQREELEFFGQTWTSQCRYITWAFSIWKAVKLNRWYMESEVL